MIDDQSKVKRSQIFRIELETFLCDLLIFELNNILNDVER